MADAHAKQHDYHLVDPSPWPAIGATSAFIMAIGAIGWMHHSFAVAPYLFGAGVIGVLYTMLSWWKDVVNEAEHGGFHTRVVQISHRYGMILFIASEVMFFVAWFWAYFDKINCFCFTEQRLAGGEKREMAVVFYVDPELAKDPEDDDLNTITLSYTFYPLRPAHGGVAVGAKS